jgi:hypothetical protein
VRNPTSAEAGDEAKHDLREDHRDSEGDAKQCRLLCAARLGHIGKRHGNGPERDRIEAKDKPGEKSDRKRGKPRVLYGLLERVHVHVRLCA